MSCTPVPPPPPHDSTRPVLTVLQRGGGHLGGGGPRPGAVAGLHHHPVLGELLEVVQDQALGVVPRGLHADDAELVVAPGAVLPVAHLVALDGPVLQVLLGGLEAGGEGVGLDQGNGY